MSKMHPSLYVGVLDNGNYILEKVQNKAVLYEEKIVSWCNECSEAIGELNKCIEGLDKDSPEVSKYEKIRSDLKEMRTKVQSL